MFLAKVMLQYSKFNWYLQTRCCGSISCCVGMCCGAVARCASYERVFLTNKLSIYISNVLSMHYFVFFFIFSLGTLPISPLCVVFHPILRQSSLLVDLILL